MLAGLALPSSDPRLADARDLAANACWPALQEALVDRFINGSAEFRANSCPFLKAKGALSALSAKQCK